MPSLSLQDGMLDEATHARIHGAHAVLDAHEGREDASPTPGRAPRSAWTFPLTRSSAAVDRVTLEAIHGLFLTGDRPDLGGGARERIETVAATYSCAALLDDPARFYRDAPPPSEMRLRELSRLSGGTRARLTWRSTYRTFDPSYQAEYDGFERNATVRAHVWLHDDPQPGGRARTTLVCLHSWCGGILPLEERIFGAARFFELGYDVALLTLPFHGARTPKQALFGGQLFPSREVRRTSEAFGQAVLDVRTLIAWLRARGAGPIALTGISLGGYTTALVASLDRSIALAAPIVAPCSFADILWHHGRGRAGRREAERAGVGLRELRAAWAIHSPLVLGPAIARERALIVWADGDVIVPRVQSLALWERWGRPETHAFVGGHVMQLGWASWQRALARRLAEVRA